MATTLVADTKLQVVNSGSLWEHSFKNESYQKEVAAIIEKYHR
jgi:hypothetical protein